MIELCKKHYIISSVFVLWCMTLCTVVTYKVFFDPVSIPTGTATAYATLFGLPALAVALLKKRMK